MNARSLAYGIGLMVLLGVSSVAVAQPRSIWWIEPSSTSVNVGETIELEVWLDVGDNVPDASPYRAIQIELVWDGRLLEILDSESQDGFWTGTGLCSSTSAIWPAEALFDSRMVASQLHTYNTTPPCPIDREPFLAFTLQFRATSPGVALLEFTDGCRLMFQATPYPILDLDYDVVPAEITVIDQNPPTATPTATATSTPTATPVLPDADNDRVADIHEHPQPTVGASNMWLPDSDGDGLTDGEEDANLNGARDPGETSTRSRDSDGDNYGDGVEVLLLLSDPLDNTDPAQPFVDNDRDGLPAGLDPNDGVADIDADRYPDGYEAVHLGIDAVTDGLLIPALGDVNSDTFVSNLDALITNAVFLESAPPDVFSGIGNSDVSRDGQISNLDALVMNSFFLILVPSLPPPGL